MKVESKKLGDNKIELDIQVPAETVKQKFTQIYEKIGKEARIPGFRPGKAPRDILEKHHSGLAREEVIKDIIPQAYKDSLEKEKIEAIELPEISQVKLESNVLSFKATVEMRPEIEVRDYKKIRLTHKKVTVSLEEVDKAIENLKQAHTPAGDACLPARQGAASDGRSHKIEAVDEKFAKRLGYKTVEEMRASIEKQLFVQKENNLRYQLQEDLLKQILSKVNFKLPQSLVARQLEELVHQAKNQLHRRGATQEQIASQEDKMRKELLLTAEGQVKTYLVLEEIAKKENIKESEHLTQEVMEFLLSEAEWVEE